MSLISSVSTSDARCGKGNTCCISRVPARMRWTSSRKGIEPQLIVILSDINMPGMDGLMLLREIKERRPDLPVIMVTAYGDEERRRRASEYGAAEFITKPVDFEFLKTQLRQLAEPSAR
jgi:CheY-like chemotaxis protein